MDEFETKINKQISKATTLKEKAKQMFDSIKLKMVEVAKIHTFALNIRNSVNSFHFNADTDKANVEAALDILTYGLIKIYNDI